MITFAGVTKQYGPEDFALQDISFEVEPGELVFITGASGSGKTTLMRLLTIETLPTAGDITFSDTLLSSISPRTVHTHRRKIGVVFQDYRLLPELNVWENIALPLFVSGKSNAEVEERVTDLLRLVQLAPKAALFPSQLSGGEAQRISIARALATGPEVIFADEPTGNLDAETAKHIADLLVKINNLGTTVLFATHDHDFLEQFPKHHRLHLEDGTLVIDTVTGAKKAKKSDTSPEPAQETEDKAAEANEIAEPEKTTKSKETAQPSDEQHSRLKKPSFWQRIFGKKKTTQKEKAEGKATEPNLDDQSEETESVEPPADEPPAEKPTKKTKPAAKTAKKTNASTDETAESDEKSVVTATIETL